MNNYLSNHWTDVTLIKLDPSPEARGPFILVEDAIDSNDPKQVRRFWLLRRDGKWIDFAVQMALKPALRAETWFDSIAQVMEVLGSLPTRPLVFQHELSDQERADALGALENLNLEAIHQRVLKWKAEQEQA